MARRPDTASTYPASADGQRLDKWLWFARVVKTRTMAAGLVQDGRVRVNRSKVTKPSQTVRVGDVITVSVARGVRVLRVAASGERRGPATEAVGLFEEIEVARPASSRTGGDNAQTPAEGGPLVERGSGRPTKKVRRTLDRLRDPFGT